MRSSSDPSSWARLLLMPFRMGRLIGVASIAIVLATIPCRSSATGPDASLRPGTPVRVKLVSGPEGWVEGRLVSLTNDSLHLATSENDTLDIPVDTILRARTRLRKSAAGRGAIVGGIVGASAGLGLGIAMTQDDFFQATPAEVVVSTVMTGACGAVLGLIVGAPFHIQKWTDLPEGWATGPTVGITPEFSVSFGWTF